VDRDLDLLERLRAGDEGAFVTLVARHQAALLRLAGSFVPSQAVAEEVVQDTWLAVLRGLAGFEGRSSFKTWLFRVLVNRARTAGVREHRSVPTGRAEPAVDPARFDATGHWAAPPQHWVDDADDRLDALALAGQLRDAMDRLPPRQREVVILRDVEGLSGEEVCDVLGVSGGNQRILLHRGRSRLRNILEFELGKA
jgi:RNA polymerase sigma-70 factor, ECF subfamily